MIVGAGLLLLGIMFLLGMLTGFAVKGDIQRVIGARGPDARNAGAALIVAELTGRELTDARGPGDRTRQIAAALNALGGITDPVESRYKAGVLAQSLNLQELLAVLKELEAMPQSPLRARVFAALLERWGSLDPRSAMAYAASPRNELDREGALLSVLQGWSRSNPADAWKWVVENPGTPSAAEQRAAAVVLQTAQADPQLAGSFVRQAPNEAMRAAGLQALLFQQLNREPAQQTTRWLDIVPPGAASAQASSYLAGEWARYAPAAAAAWAQQLGDDARPAAIAAVARSWGQANPGAAATWVTTLPAGPGRAEAAAAVADAWLNLGGAGNLAQWLNAQEPHPDLDSAVAALARETALHDPANALSWAGVIQDPAERELAGLAIGRDWLARAPNAARAAIRDSALDDSTKRALLGEPAPAVVTAQPAQQPAPPQAQPTAPQAQAAPEPQPAEPAPEPEVEQVVVEEIYVEDPDLDPYGDYSEDETTYYEPIDEAAPPPAE